MRAPLLWLALAASSAVFGAAPEYGYRILHVYPHDRDAFTQGLEYRGGFLYESTGLRGHSTLRKVKLETGEVLQEIHLSPALFGEGITVLDDRIIQLTWQAHTGFVYDGLFFRKLLTFQYPGEGWGLANDGKWIYMSDGTAEIRIWDPVNLQEHKRLKVHDGLRPIENLNELECVKDEIYANVWQTDRIARISPADGHVTGWIDLTGLLTRDDLSEPVDVLNGIAYDAGRNRLFVTGKLWPKVFEIKLIPKKR
ncbi:MAG: glutaminyl-peptide cyclotransferase [Bryobacteraceae bacterium]